MKEFNSIYEELTALNESPISNGEYTLRLAYELGITNLKELEDFKARYKKEHPGCIDDLTTMLINYKKELGPNFQINSIMDEPINEDIKLRNVVEEGRLYKILCNDGNGQILRPYSAWIKDQGQWRRCDKDFKTMEETKAYLKSRGWLDEALTKDAEEEPEIPESFDDKMDFLAADEQEAIDGYDLIIAALSDGDANVKEQLEKIKTEEIAHKEFLEKVKEDHNLVYTEPLEQEEVKENLTESTRTYQDILTDEPETAMYIAREIVYGMVDDADSAAKLATWGEDYGLEADELIALDILIDDALVGANEHEAAKDYMHNKSLPLYLSGRISDYNKKLANRMLAKCTTDKKKKELLFAAINCLVLDGYLK